MTSTPGLLGYTLVSSNGQDLQLQPDALLKAGVLKKLISWTPGQNGMRARI
jgi:hypothetical protein